MKIRYILSIITLLLLYMIVGIGLPYVKTPVLEDYEKEEISKKQFHSENAGTDRAKIITDNDEALGERIRMISQAGERIILSTFAFESDYSGMKMISALNAAADRGVQVQILVDGFNSWLSMEGNPYFIALANHENVQIKLYNKVNLLKPWKAMSRMHDKYIVADEAVYIAGGRNTFDYFLGNTEGYKNYDTDVLVYNTGSSQSSIYEIIGYFDQIWEMDCCELWHEESGIDIKQPSVQEAKVELQQTYSMLQDERNEWFVAVDYKAITVPTNKVSLLSGSTGLYAKKPKVFYGLCRLMADAKENVTIHTPYIICNTPMYQAFSEICSKSTDVILMTNSVENNGNPFGAVDYYLNKEKILNTGLQVLEFDGDRSYHSKCIAIDDRISIVGSFNMDMKSTYQSTEIMVVIDSIELNQQLRGIMEGYHRSAKTADLKDADELFAKGVPTKNKIQRWFIKVIDPYVRFLL